MGYFYSDSDEGEQNINTVIVNDTGISTWRVKVLFGVPAFDGAADITIIGSDLFKKVASLSLQTPHHAYMPFTLNSRIALDLTFGDTMIKTPVYVKMDAFGQLLLFEGVSIQLGIINYHPQVRKWNRSKLESMCQSDDEEGKELAAEPPERDGHCEVSSGVASYCSMPGPGVK